MKSGKHRAVFLDRDGVINKKAPEGDYIKSWGEFEFLPGAKKAIRKLNENGFLVIVVSNQRGIAKGIMSESALKEIWVKMEEELSKVGARLDDIYYCSHDIVDNCGCRKPEPGLLLRAAREHDIDLGRSWMIGDSESDIEAGKRAGCRTILIEGSPLNDNSRASEADLVANSLVEAVSKLIEMEDNRNGA